MDKARKLPFSVNRNDARSLVDQVADGLRQAIVSGYWRVGDEIPSTRELMPILGVSHIVTRAALSRLTAEGYVLTRHGLHPAVRDRNAKRWLGHVVLAYPESDLGYFQTVFAEELRGRLAQVDYLTTQVRVGRRSAEGYDLSALDAALSRSVDLAVVLYARPEIFALLAKRKVPFVVAGQGAKAPVSAVGFTRLDYDAGVPDFAAACRAAGVREVVQFSWDRQLCNAVPGLRKAGIKARDIMLRPDLSVGQLAGVERAGLDAFAALIASGKVKPSRETAYFFGDDYIARGALTAMLCAGLRTPGDILVATWANSGLGPVHPKALSRMEMDPVSAGATVAAAVQDYFKTGAYPKGLVIAPKWIKGESL